MAITGIKVCDFVVWTPKGTHVQTIHFDSDFWNRICVPKLEYFFFFFYFFYSLKFCTPKNLTCMYLLIIPVISRICIRSKLSIMHMLSQSTCHFVVITHMSTIDN